MNSRSSILFAFCVLALGVSLAFGSGHNWLCKIEHEGGGVTKYPHVIVYGEGDGYKRAIEAKAGSKTPVAVVYEESIGIRSVRTAIANNSLPKGTVAIENGSLKPDAGLESLNNRVGKVIIIHDIPVTQEHAVAIHGTKLGESTFQSNQKQFGIYTQTLAQKNAIHLVEQQGSARDNLLAAVKSAQPDDLVVIIGHSERIATLDAATTSRKLLLHDGTFVLSSELKVCPGNVWTMSCNWAEVIRPNAIASRSLRRINYGEAVEAASSIRANETYMQNMFRLQNLVKPKNIQELSLPKKLKEKLNKVPETERTEPFTHKIAQVEENVFDCTIAVVVTV